jgi:ElaB/YqjD/DUF883 family membrane-anchored ribosome-binding protein
MAQKDREIEKKLEDKIEKLKGLGSDEYAKLIDRLYAQRDNLRRELDREYGDARRYVRSNPEGGVLIGVAAGIAIGVLLVRWVR